MNKDGYDEFFVRCPSCNEQIASKSVEFRKLLEVGISVEESLNKLGVLNICSRISLMSPSYIFHNIENQMVIRGYIDVKDNNNFRNSERIYSIYSKDDKDKNLKPSKLDEDIINNLVLSEPKRIKKINLNFRNNIEYIEKNDDFINTDDEDIILPTVVNKPTFNPGRYGRTFINIGNNKMNEVLTGRTYLAR